MKDSHARSILKSVLWRVIGVIILATITYIFTRNWITTGLITIIHHGTFLLVFYLHERFWFNIQCKNDVLRKVLKACSYEIILGMGLGGLIVLIITGSWTKVSEITLTYTAIKLITYYIYETLWIRKNVVYAYVVADLLHIGHIKHLQRAKKLGDYLIVGVLTDEATMEKKKKPILSFEERRDIVKAIKYVDKVVPQKTYSPLNNVKKIMPDVLMESDSHEEQPANDYVKSYGGMIVVSPYYTGQSSSEIKNKVVKEWNAETVNI